MGRGGRTSRKVFASWFGRVFANDCMEKPIKNEACNYTVTIFGDLRSYERAQDAVNWFKEKLKTLGYDNVRNAAITATNEYGPPASWTLDEL